MKELQVRRPRLYGDLDGQLERPYLKFSFQLKINKFRTTAITNV